MALVLLLTGPETGYSSGKVGRRAEEHQGRLMVI
jgi:hypothetical protein